MAESSHLKLVRYDTVRLAKGCEVATLYVQWLEKMSEATNINSVAVSHGADSIVIMTFRLVNYCF